jgi:glutaredoxin 3
MPASGALQGHARPGQSGSSTRTPRSRHERRPHVHHPGLPLLRAPRRCSSSAACEHIDEIRVDLDPVQRDHMIALTGRRTVPQIFIGDTHVGGCDDLIALDQRAACCRLLAG